MKIQHEGKTENLYLEFERIFKDDTEIEFTSDSEKDDNELRSDFQSDTDDFVLTFQTYPIPLMVLNRKKPT